MKRILLSALAVTAMGCSGLAAAEEPFPSKPIRLIVVYPAGGSGDAMARTLSDTFSAVAGQPLVIENRGGASGMIGTSACKSAAPDGYTFCLLLSDVVTINPFVFKKVPYDADRDLVPVAAVADAGAAVIVPAALPTRNLGEFTALARSQPGKLNWGSFGVGTSSHLLLAQINKTFNVEVQHIPYQSAPQIMTALLTKEADVSLVTPGLFAQYVDQGKIRPIAVLGSKRLPQIPDVPTLIEQGLNFKPTLWYGIFAPAGVKPAVVDQMNKLVNRSLADSGLVKRLQDQGFVATPMSPAAFAERNKQDRQEWGAVARELKPSLE